MASAITEFTHRSMAAARSVRCPRRSKTHFISKKADPGGHTCKANCASAAGYIRDLKTLGVVNT